MSNPIERATIKALDGIVGGFARRANNHQQEEATKDLLLGQANDLYRPSRKEDVFLSTEERLKHLHIIGATGVGKTRLIDHLSNQDILADNGFALADPHRELVERKLRFIACQIREGKSDQDLEYISRKLVFVDPLSPWAVGFNPLEPKGSDPFTEVTALMEIFRKTWRNYWGPRMEQTLRSCLYTLSVNGMTLVEANLLLSNPAFRAPLVAGLPEGEIKEFWRRFDQLSERMQMVYAEPLMTRISAFVTEPSIRTMVGQAKSTINFREIMDSGKWLLISLSKARLKSSADLLASLILARVQLEAASRIELPPAKRRPFIFYVDEFQNYATDDFVTMASESRKMGLGLVIAHQFVDQLDKQLRSALLGNTHAQVLFRLSNSDASLMSGELSQQERPIIQRRLIDLKVREAYFKRKGERPRLMKTPYVSSPNASDREVEQLKRLSFSNYAKPRAAVEEEIRSRTAMYGIRAPARPIPVIKRDIEEGRFAPSGEFEEAVEW